MNTTSLVFKTTTFDVIDRNNQPWLRLFQIGSALGYANPSMLVRIYQKHAAEFTDGMTALVKLQTAGGEQETRIFSLRGAHLLGMFARTEKAEAFRRWALDVLERETLKAEQWQQDKLSSAFFPPDGRYLVRIASGRASSPVRVPEHCYIVGDDDFAKTIRDPGCMVPLRILPDIIKACAERIDRNLN